MIVLDHLTAWELSPPALVSGAAESGYDAVSMWFHAPPFGTERYPMLGDIAMRRETIARSRDTGIAIFSIGLFVLTPAGFATDWEAMLESGAALGARRAIALVYDDDASRARDTLVRLAARAAVHGIGVDVEFIAGSGVASLAAACTLVREVGGADCGIILDPLHLQRTGGTPNDISPVERPLIRYAQLCDGPATMPPDRWLYEGSEQRQLPGAGAFPLAAFLAALPDDIPIGLEIPLRDLAKRGVGPVARSRLALDAARAFLQRNAERATP
jgi:sugar phosphate isomerase/epimerase